MSKTIAMFAAALALIAITPACTDIILTVIDTLDVLDQYEPVITTARLSVELLKVNIPA